jgi:hypothetical protein
MVNVPTAANLKARYPEFTPVADARITLFIEEAARSVDDSWIETDQSPAIISLACHQMSLEGEPASSSGGSAGSGNAKDGRFLKSRKVSDVSNEWAESEASKATGTLSATASQAEYRSTSYGANFLRLMKLNHSGMRVV